MWLLNAFTCFCCFYPWKQAEKKTCRLSTLLNGGTSWIVHANKSIGTLLSAQSFATSSEHLNPNPVKHWRCFDNKKSPASFTAILWQSKVELWSRGRRRNWMMAWWNSPASHRMPAWISSWPAFWSWRMGPTRRIRRLWFNTSSYFKLQDRLKDSRI